MGNLIKRIPLRSTSRFSKNWRKAKRQEFNSYKLRKI